MLNLWVIVFVLGYIAAGGGSREMKVMGKIMYIGNGTKLLSTEQ